MNTKSGSTTLRRIGQRARLQIIALMNVTGFVVTLAVLAWLIVRENVPLVALVGALIPLTLLPSVAFVVMALLLRAWRAALLNLLPALLFLALYHSYLLPRPVVTPEGREITFVTFNLHTDPDAAVDQIAVIREINADIVSLQEVSGPTAKLMQTALADIYPYQVSRTRERDVMGRAILSRYPLSNDTMVISAGRPMLLRADVSLDGQTPAFTVYSIHLDIPDWRRLIDYNANKRGINRRDLITLSDRESLPLVMLGDFNGSDYTNDILDLNTHFGEACLQRCQGLSLTFPSTEQYPFPFNLAPSLIRLDYVFFDDHWQALTSDVWYTSGGSDHRPLKATLALKTE